MDSNSTATAPAPSPDSTGHPVPSLTEPAQRRRTFTGLLPHLLALLVVLAPAAGAFWLVHEYVVNTPHYDDFTFLEDWIKFKQGTLSVGDLFSVHLEHRVTVPRLLALGAHVLGRNLRTVHRQVRLRLDDQLFPRMMRRGTALLGQLP